MAFKSSSSPSLPTWNQFRKSAIPDSSEYFCGIERILWNEEWLTITFFTDAFRYSFKCSDKTEWETSVGELKLLESVPHVLYFQWIKDPGEAEVIFTPIKNADQAAELTEFQILKLSKAKVFDWGIVIEQAQSPKLSKQARERKSGRLSSPAS